MPSRRPDGEPRLVDRVRWGNLARLGAVVAAGLLIALGPRACGGATDGAGGGPALPPDQPVAVAPEPVKREAEPRRGDAKPVRKRPPRAHPARHAKRRGS